MKEPYRQAYQLVYVEKQKTLTLKYFVKAAYTYYDLVTDIFILRNFCEKNGENKQSRDKNITPGILIC